MGIRLMDKPSKVTIRRETRDLVNKMVSTTSVPFYVLVHACVVYSFSNLDGFLGWFGATFLQGETLFSPGDNVQLDDAAAEVPDDRFDEVDDGPDG